MVRSVRVLSRSFPSKSYTRALTTVHWLCSVCTTDTDTHLLPVDHSRSDDPYQLTHLSLLREGVTMPLNYSKWDNLEVSLDFRNAAVSID